MIEFLKFTDFSLAVGQPPVVQNLQKQVEHFGMRFFDLIEQDQTVRPMAHHFRELASFVVTHIARRRTDEPARGMALHIFRHVDADQRFLIVEHEFGERAGELGLSDAGRPKEHE